VIAGPLRAIVVGSGLAGLAAARRLEARGAQVVLLEARTRVGGSLAAEPPRLFPCVLPRSAPRLLALLHELGMSEQVAREPLVRVLVPGRGGPRLRSTSMRSALRGDPLGGLRLARLQSIAEWLGARVDPGRPDLETRLDDRSVADLCSLYLGRRAYRSLLAPLVESALGLDARETSRELLFTWLGPAGDVELSLAHGLSALPGRIARALSGVRLRSRAVAVLEGGRGVRLESGELLRADAVVLGVAPQEVLRLVGDLGHVEREILSGCRSSTEHWLALECTAQIRPAAPLGWCDGLALFDATRDGANGTTLMLRARAKADPATLVARVEPLLPGLSRQLREQHAYLREGVPAFGVGHFRRVARLFSEAARRRERHVHLCGDYLVGPDAESKIASGERAAQSVLAGYS
jgi:protoporphyrinogen oxidase